MGGSLRFSRRALERSSCVSLSGAKVRAHFALDVAQPQSEVWRIIADLPRFLCIDPYHTQVTPLCLDERPGVHLVLEHNAFGVRFRRFGRLLSWREGHGYSFSDLSALGPTRGFPHVFSVGLEPVGDAETGRSWTRLTVTVKGKWTARWIPRALALSWLKYTCREHLRLLRGAL